MMSEYRKTVYEKRRILHEKTYLYEYLGKKYIIFPNGSMILADKAALLDFLLKFRPSYYYEFPKNQYSDDYINKVKKQGRCLANRDCTNNLHIRSSMLLREIIYSININDYLTVAEYAQLHNKGISIVRKLCKENRIPGAQYIGGQWLIPKTSPYPPRANAKDNEDT